MPNIIAIIWDFDKTLVDGYMQDPIFKEYGVDSKLFWQEVMALPKKYADEQGVKVNPDTIYLNHFINYTKQGKFAGLNNKKLREFGKKLNFYSGVRDIFKDTKELIENNEVYREHDIKVEHYIVSTGMAEVIKGSYINEYVEEVWGCEFIEAADENENMIISEIGYTIDNTTKTRAIFEINKGVNRHRGVEVNTTIPKEDRRVHFVNMLYIADGPSDIPAFSVIHQNKGATFAIYPKGDTVALNQVEQMRKDGRVDTYAEADYSKGTMAHLWICNKIKEFADRICKEEKEKILKYAERKTPKHLNS